MKDPPKYSLSNIISSQPKLTVTDIINKTISHQYISNDDKKIVNIDGNTPLHVYLKNNINPSIDIIRRLETIDVLNKQNTKANRYLPINYYIKKCENIQRNIIRLLKTNTNLHTSCFYGIPLNHYIQYNVPRVDIIRELKTTDILNTIHNNNIPLTKYLVDISDHDVTDIDVVKELLTPTNINMSVLNGDSPLSVYVRNNKHTEDYDGGNEQLFNLDIIKLLKTPTSLKISERFDCVLDEYLTLNYYTRADVIMELAHPSILNKQQGNGWTPLMRYLWYSNDTEIDVVKALRTDENINFYDDNNVLLLTWYIYTNDIVGVDENIVKLLSSTYNLNTVSGIFTEMNELEFNGTEHTPLSFYIFYSHNIKIDIINLLKTPTNIKMTNFYGCTPLGVYKNKMVGDEDKILDDIINALK